MDMDDPDDVRDAQLDAAADDRAREAATPPLSYAEQIVADREYMDRVLATMKGRVRVGASSEELNRVRRYVCDAVRFGYFSTARSLVRWLDGEERAL